MPQVLQNALNNVVLVLVHNHHDDTINLPASLEKSSMKVCGGRNIRYFPQYCMQPRSSLLAPPKFEM